MGYWFDKKNTKEKCTKKYEPHWTLDNIKYARVEENPKWKAELLNKSENIHVTLSPIYVTICAICFSMTIGILWEFFEFSCDVFLHTDMQKDFIIGNIYSVMLNPENNNKAIAVKNITEVSVNGEMLPVNGYLDIGLYDTMKDMFVALSGCMSFVILILLFGKKKKSHI